MPVGNQTPMPMPMPTATAPMAAAPKVNATADFTVDSVAFTKEFVDNPDAAHQKYTGKSLIISGTTYGGLKALKGWVGIFSGAQDPKVKDELFIVSVTCHFPDTPETNQRLQALKAGQQLTLKGWYDNFKDGNVNLVRSEFVD
jgi:hypothetical protein